MLVSSFNLSQSFNYTPYLFSKNGSNQRSILSVYGPSFHVVFLPFPSNPSFSKKVNNAIWKVPHYFLKKLIHIDECCYFWKLSFLRTIFCRIFYDFAVRLTFHTKYFTSVLPVPESVATLPPFSPIEGQKWFDQISSQWESQKNWFALTYFGKIQFLPPCIWILPFMSTASDSGSDRVNDKTFQISRNLGLEHVEFFCLLNSQPWMKVFYYV